MKEMVLQLTDEQYDAVNSGTTVMVECPSKSITFDVIRPRLLIVIGPSPEEQCHPSS